METLCRVAQTTSGRDRLSRLVQYGSKVVSWSLEVRGKGDESVKKLKDLEASIGTARKLFRLGMSIENLRAALRTIHLTDPALRFLVTIVKLNRSLYLLLDHLLWASRMRLINIDSAYWGRLSNRFWIAAIFFSLLRDIYELLVAVRQERTRRQQYGSTPAPPSSGQLLSSVAANNPGLVVDFVKNMTDLWIPVSRVNLVVLPDGLVGLLGVISSIAGLMGSCDQRLKLKFS